MFSIKIEDIALFPVYVALFYYILKRIKSKSDDPILQLYLKEDSG
jgi:hypothetical protein